MDLRRLGQVFDIEDLGWGQLLINDLVAEVNALITDVDARPSDQLLDLPLRLPAERAKELLVCLGGLGHPLRSGSGRAH